VNTNQTAFINPRSAELISRHPVYKPIKVWAKLIKSGDSAALSRAITLVESRLDTDKAIARKLLAICIPARNKSIRLGITGPPGAGKSSFIEFIGNELIQLNRNKIAVLTIDPSSPDQGGSILGDKTRMQTLAQQPRVFIRPSPSRQYPGGVNAQTRKSIQLCEYAGYDTILVETVGVGQAEHTVSEITDLTILIIPPAGGDELQGIKKGITEIVDLIIVNKNDSGLEDQVKYTQSQYQSAVHLSASKAIKVMKCSSILKSGFDPIWNQVQSLIQERKRTGQWKKNRDHQQFIWFDNIIRQEWMSDLEKYKEMKALKNIRNQVNLPLIDIDSLAHQYLIKLKKLALN